MTENPIDVGVSTIQPESQMRLLPATKYTDISVNESTC